MATVTAFTPFDMDAYAIVNGTAGFASSTTFFQEETVPQLQYYYGHDFTFQSDASSGGVLNSTEYYLESPNPVLQYSVTGLDHSMFTFNAFRTANNPQGLLGFLLSGNDSFVGSSGDDFAKGYFGNDTLEGGNGNDTLDGGLGADTLSGGVGSDIYLVDNPGDVVGEAPADLIPDGDLIIASLTYTLPPTMEHLVLAGTAPINGTGNDFPNAMTGNDAGNVLDGAAGNDTISAAAGNDLLIGGSGTDVLAGGPGNDTYVLDGAGDTVTEAAGAGTDEVQTVVTLGVALADNVENLRLLGSASIDGSGNALSNTLYANSGNNVLSGGDGTDTVSYQFGATAGVTVSLAAMTAQATGGSGSDTLVSIERLIGSGFADRLTGNNGNNVLKGTLGDDVLTGGDGEDSLVGGSGLDWAHYGAAGAGVTVRLTSREAQNTGGAGVDTLSSVENLVGSAYDDSLTGNGAANHLKGTAGDDALIGRAGNDTLSGSGGEDRFTFNVALNASTNVDTVSDFNPALDRIRLDDEVFSELAVGKLAADAFYSAPGATSGSDAEDRIVYDSDTGNLFYDPDGVGNAVATLFAILTGAPMLAAADFLVIA